MRYRALACDYDGTIAERGRVGPEVKRALERVPASGRSLILVTGRQLRDLLRLFPAASAVFDCVVAENGAVLHSPRSGETRLLAPPPPRAFVSALTARGVEPLDAGEVIVATSEPNAPVVLGCIHQLGLELQVVLNKGSLMVLPWGVDKATGLAAALAQLGLSWRDVVGVGDAENDHAFLAKCALGVAVADALPMVKVHANLVLDAPDGDGVVQLIDALVTSDLAGVEARAAPARR